MRNSWTPGATAVIGLLRGIPRFMPFCRSLRASPIWRRIDTDCALINSKALEWKSTGFTLPLCLKFETLASSLLTFKSFLGAPTYSDWIGQFGIKAVFQTLEIAASQNISLILKQIVLGRPISKMIGDYQYDQFYPNSTGTHWGDLLFWHQKHDANRKFSSKSSSVQNYFFFLFILQLYL